MKQCPTCQASNKDDAVFCLECGTQLDENAPQEKKKSGKGNTVLLVIAILFAVIAIAATGLTYYLHEELQKRAVETSSIAAAVSEEVVSKQEDAAQQAEQQAADPATPYLNKIETAKKAVLGEWQKRLKESKTKNNGYAQIVSTRVIKIKANENDYFKNVDCVVEFVLRADYYGTAPYYFDMNMYDNAVFYKDGTCKAVSGFFRTYIAQTAKFDCNDVIDAIVDFGDRFNEEIPKPAEDETASAVQEAESSAQTAGES